MTWEEYSKWVSTRMFTDPDKMAMLGPVGLSGEAGEVLELYKKHYFHGKEIDRTKLLHELGDVVFYLTAILNMEGWNLELVMRANNIKLENRDDGRYKADKP